MNQTQVCCLTPTNDYWMDFWVQLLATLIGVGIGFGLPLFVDWIKKDQRIKETKKRILSAIIEELESSKNGLEDPKFQKTIMSWHGKPDGFVGGYLIITNPAYDSAINSGEFSLLPPATQTELGECYNKLIDFSEIMKKMLDFYTTPVFTTDLADKQAEKLLNNFHTRLSNLIKSINDILPKLKNLRDSLG